MGRDRKARWAEARVGACWGRENNRLGALLARWMRSGEDAAEAGALGTAVVAGVEAC